MLLTSNRIPSFYGSFYFSVCTRHFEGLPQYSSTTHTATHSRTRTNIATRRNNHVKKLPHYSGAGMRRRVRDTVLLLPTLRTSRSVLAPTPSGTWGLLRELGSSRCQPRSPRLSVAAVHCITVVLSSLEAEVLYMHARVLFSYRVQSYQSRDPAWTKPAPVNLLWIISPGTPYSIYHGEYAVNNDTTTQEEAAIVPPVRNTAASHPNTQINHRLSVHGLVAPSRFDISYTSVYNSVYTSSCFPPKM